VRTRSDSSGFTTILPSSLVFLPTPQPRVPNDPDDRSAAAAGQLLTVTSVRSG